MDIAVVVPTFNRAGLLPVTLDAILAQTLPANKVIVVDDGSTDDTPAVLRSYASKVRIIRVANGGELVARNTGLRQATSDLVAFCDSDDLWRPDRLAAVAALWSAAPEVKFAFGNFVIVRDGGWETREKFADAPPGFWDGMRPLPGDTGMFDRPIINRLLAFQPFFPSTLVVRREFFAAVGGWDEAVTGLVGCDFATTLRLAEHVPFAVMRRPLVGIRKHVANFSADVQEMNLGDSRVLEYALATRPSLAPHGAAIRASIDRRRVAALDTAFARQDLAAVREIFALLPAGAGGVATRLKGEVAKLPPPLARRAASALMAVRGIAGPNLGTSRGSS